MYYSIPWDIHEKTTRLVNNGIASISQSETETVDAGRLNATKTQKKKNKNSCSFLDLIVGILCGGPKIHLAERQGTHSNRAVKRAVKSHRHTRPAPSLNRTYYANKQVVTVHKAVGSFGKTGPPKHMLAYASGDRQLLAVAEKPPKCTFLGNANNRMHITSVYVCMG